jgi:zinc and cadmium transporter
VCATLLGGIVAFFLLEKTMLWRHEHGPAAEPAPTGPLILIGDGFHNFVDGVVIAAAFLTSVPLGVAATVAVIAHEIPQEVGDYAVLLDSGYGPWRAFLLNGLSAAATLPGALAGYLWLPQVSDAVPYVLALSAASFVYIAMADLLPMLRRWNAPWRNLLQLALLFAGIATIALMAAP